ncbi:MAG: T9SS type A sorting domain-containing protein [Crocinitomix sp.]|nr:T9SS type A sorting domain-containing protein [Crocinitomix sp.]
MFKKSLFLVFTIISIMSHAQFGFERSDMIDVINAGETQEFPWAGGMDYCQFSSIDLDFDGVEDLFVFDRTCDKVMTFLQKGGTGESKYEYAPEYEKDFPADLHHWALLVDYNCDGKKDIFTYRIGAARVFLNTGDEVTGNTFILSDPLVKENMLGGEAPLYLSPSDIPAIVDVDGDSDLDILAFGVTGTTVYYFKNLSQELYGICDSLVYERKNECWGRFKEDVSSNVVTLWDTLVPPCRAIDFDDPEGPARVIGANQDRHAGSTVLALDMDDSGVLDLILGDISYSSLTMLMNAGEAVNTNSGMESQDNAFPSTSVSVDLPIFPAAYHVDINNDGKRDLVVAPNSKVGSENVESVWSYVNGAEDLEPDFIFDDTDFLQGEMIEVGTSSLPVLFDHNGDGLKDLLVSSFGRYNSDTENLISKIAYYENVGTAEAPLFEFVTDDYQDISTMGIGETLTLYPTFGDLDGDGDEDMILGEYLGYCYYMENTGGAGSPAIFNTFVLLLNSDGAPIHEGTYCYPHLVDLDREGDFDLVIGRRNGKLQYLENSGIGTYNFTEVTDNLGGVDVSGATSVEGFAVPQFIDVDGEYHLLVGSKRGYVYYYDDVDLNIEGSFHLVDSIVDNINIGTYSAPAVANLNDNNRLELVLGNRRGGVALYQSASTSNISLVEYSTENEIAIYPNPASNNVTISLGAISANELKQTKVVLSSISGKTIMTVNPQANTFSVDVEQFAKGVYLIHIFDENKIITKKLILE